MNSVQNRGFTLIELLVVVAIISILLALLMPALDKAIYQAELVQCGSNQKGVTGGVTLYTMDFHRTYPYRHAVNENDISYQIAFIRQPFGTSSGDETGTAGGADDRPELMPYVNLDMLVDPLSGQIDLSPTATSTLSWISTNYSLAFGYKHRVDGGGMFRMGNKLSWSTFRYGQLLGDHFRADPTNVNASHPDTQNTMAFTRVQNGTWFGEIKQTTSFWGGARAAAGTFDLNFAYPDGSVRRFSNIAAPPADNPLNAGDYPLLPAPILIESNEVGSGADWLGR